MKTIYLHIGTPKTGTSALQQFFYDNRELLAKNGVCYQRMPFSYVGIGDGRNGHFVVGDEKNRKEISFDKIEKGEKTNGYDMISDWFQQYDTVLLTDEGIWNAIATKEKDAIRKFQEYCNQNNYLLKIIVYLRNQDEYLESIWKQRVRRHGATWDFKYITKRIPKSIVLDYDKHLSKIEKIVGQENIIVRRYQKNRFLGDAGNIFSDFLDAIGLSWSKEYEVPQEQTNLSLKNNYAEIKRILNNLLPEEQSVREAEEKFFEKTAVDCSRLEKEQYESSMFSKEEREKFLARYAESNRKVAERYFGEMELFPEEQSKKENKPKWEVDNRQQYEDTILFFGTALLRQQQEIDKLRQKMNQKENTMPLKRLLKKIRCMKIMDF